MTDRYFLPALLVIAGAVALIASPAFMPPSPPQAPPKDRARFMLECVQDFQNTPETCSAVWAGTDPPQQPDGADIPGC